MLRNWHADGLLDGIVNIDPDHPLLVPDDPDWSFLRLTKEEYDQFCAEQLPSTASESGSPVPGL